MTREAKVHRSGSSPLSIQVAFALLFGMVIGAMFGIVSVLLGAAQQGSNLAFLLLISASWGSALGVGVGATSGILAKISQLPRWHSWRQRRIAYTAAAASGSAPIWILFLNSPSVELKSASLYAALSAIVAVVAWLVFPRFERQRILRLGQTHRA